MNKEVFSHWNSNFWPSQIITRLRPLGVSYIDCVKTTIGEIALGYVWIIRPWNHEHHFMCTRAQSGHLHPAKSHLGLKSRATGLIARGSYRPAFLQRWPKCHIVNHMPNAWQSSKCHKQFGLIVTVLRFSETSRCPPTCLIYSMPVSASNSPFVYSSLWRKHVPLWFVGFLSRSYLLRPVAYGYNEAPLPRSTAIHDEPASHQTFAYRVTRPKSIWNGWALSVSRYYLKQLIWYNRTAIAVVVKRSLVSRSARELKVTSVTEWFWVWRKLQRTVWP